jgi:cytochrome P450
VSHRSGTILKRLWEADGARGFLNALQHDMRSVVTDPRFSGEFAHPDFPTVTEARVVVDKEERAFVGMDNPRHDHYRRMFTKEFTAKRMIALRPKMAAIANRLIDALVAQPQPADLVAAIAVPFPSLVMCDLVGSSYDDHRFIIECAAGRHGLLQTPRQASQKARELADYFMRLILRKEKEPGDDLVSRVIEEHVRPGNLSREDFAEIGAMILRAGHDTTTNMIGLGTLILLQHPEQAAAVARPARARAGRRRRAAPLHQPRAVPAAGAWRSRTWPSAGS